ncbi:MAG: glycine zipper 2TM domain-containing protein [Caulobacterales bacterium]|nr:glycine zipper 2TM domain-containing protein [Caulobacterales bacterium]
MTDPITTMRARALAAALVAGVAATGCASGLGANDYNRAEVGDVNRVEEGVVESARQVNIEGTKTGIGTASGAAIGGVAGSQIGGDDEARIIAGIAGALAGGLLGRAVEEGATASVGYTYTVRLQPSGELISITQEAGAGEYMLPAGTPVLIHYGRRARVTPRS